MGRRRKRKNGNHESEFTIHGEHTIENGNNYLYEMKECDSMGRYLTAKMDLEAGTIFLQDEPLVIGPTQGVSPMCIACYKPLDIATSARCHLCLWPLCKSDCEFHYKNHGHSVEECQILKTSKETPTTVDYSIYDSLMPLRVLLLKLKNDKSWKTIRSMESHNKFRESTEAWEIDKKIIDFIKNKCKMHEVLDDEIHSICGYIQVNAFGIEGKSASGLYPKAFLLSHDCTPNTSHMIDKDYRMIIRTTKSAAKGELLTLSYCSTLQGSHWRRTVLKGSKFFDCKCRRCSDPSELQTFMSAIKCQKCNENYLLPNEPLNYKCPWNCNKCFESIQNDTVCNLIKKISDEADNLRSEDIKQSEQFLKVYKDKLHPQHFIMVSTKFKLSQMYGKLPNYMIHTMSEEQLRRKKDICSELLNIFDMIEPGLSRIRGVTLYELHAPLLLLAQIQYQKSKNKIKFKRDIKAVVDYLSEANHILSFEDLMSPEGQLGSAAAEALQQIKIQMRKGFK